MCVLENLTGMCAMCMDIEISKHFGGKCPKANFSSVTVQFHIVAGSIFAVYVAGFKWLCLGVL